MAKDSIRAFENDFSSSIGATLSTGSMRASVGLPCCLLDRRFQRLCLIQAFASAQRKLIH
jgi:hypothetical protein